MYLLFLKEKKNHKSLLLTIIQVCLIYLCFPLPDFNFKQPNPPYMPPIFICPMHFLLFGMGENTEMLRDCICFSRNTINYYLIFSEHFTFHIYREGELFSCCCLQGNLWILSNSERSHKEGLKLICTVCCRSDSLQSLDTKP